MHRLCQTFSKGRLHIATRSTTRGEFVQAFEPVVRPDFAPVRQCASAQRGTGRTRARRALRRASRRLLWESGPRGFWVTGSRRGRCVRRHEVSRVNCSSGHSSNTVSSLTSVGPRRTAVAAIHNSTATPASTQSPVASLRHQVSGDHKSAAGEVASVLGFHRRTEPEGRCQHASVDADSGLARCHSLSAATNRSHSSSVRSAMTNSSGPS